MDERIKENSVIQVNERGFEGWVGCLIQVSEVKTWGIQGWIKVPKSGNAYIRLKWDQIEYIGDAVMFPQST